MNTLYRDEKTGRLYVWAGKAKTYGVYQYENEPEHYHVLLRSVDQYEVREYVAGGTPGGYAYEHVTDFVKAIPGPLGKDQKAKAVKP